MHLIALDLTKLATVFLNPGNGSSHLLKSGLNIGVSGGANLITPTLDDRASQVILCDGLLYYICIDSEEVAGKDGDVTQSKVNYVYTRTYCIAPEAIKTEGMHLHISCVYVCVCEISYIQRNVCMYSLIRCNIAKGGKLWNHCG